MNKLLATVLAGALIGTAGVANAADQGFYLQGELGYVGQVSIPNITGYSKSQDHFGGRASLGYLTCLMPEMNWGGEIGWGYYGSTEWKSYSTGGKVRHKTYAYDLLLVGQYKFDDHFSGVGKVGIAYYGERVENQGLLFTDARDETVRGFRPMLNVGIAYTVVDNIDLSLSYTRLFGKSISATGTKTSFEETPSAQAVFAGVKYTFA